MSVLLFSTSSFPSSDKHSLNFMVNYLKALYDTLVSMDPAVAGAIFVFTFLISVFHYVNAMWETLLAKMAALVLTADTASMAIDGMSWFNYAFPLTEFFTFASGCALAYATAATIRIIKSFIPTIA